MSSIGDPDAKYMVSTDNGAICLYTDDLDEAFIYAGDLNERGPDSLHEKAKEFLGSDSPDPGTARVFENTDQGFLVEVAKGDNQ